MFKNLKIKINLIEIKKISGNFIILEDTMLDILNKLSIRVKMKTNQHKKGEILKFSNYSNIFVKPNDLWNSSNKNDSDSFSTKNDDDDDMNGVIPKNCTLPEKCDCFNCTTLSLLTECGVCLEPLQSRGIRSCRICSNLTCINCAIKLQICAFCRTLIPLQRNRAIERLLNQLILPSTINSRIDCKVLLDGSNKLKHEEIWTISRIVCSKYFNDCTWQGSVENIETHFKTSHGSKFFKSDGFNVNVSNICEEAKLKKVYQFTACLKYYNQLFFIRINATKGKIILFYSRFGYIKPVLMKCTIPNYGVTIKITRLSKKLKTTLPIKTPLYAIQKVEIKSKRLALDGEVYDKNSEVNIKVRVHEIK